MEDLVGSYPILSVVNEVTCIGILKQYWDISFNSSGNT
jgi:hypothetical protein